MSAITGGRDSAGLVDRNIAADIAGAAVAADGYGCIDGVAGAARGKANHSADRSTAVTAAATDALRLNAIGTIALRTEQAVVGYVDRAPYATRATRSADRYAHIHAGGGSADADRSGNGKAAVATAATDALCKDGR